MPKWKRKIYITRQRLKSAALCEVPQPKDTFLEDAARELGLDVDRLKQWHDAERYEDLISVTYCECDRERGTTCIYCFARELGFDPDEIFDYDDGN